MTGNFTENMGQNAAKNGTSIRKKRYQLQLTTMLRYYWMWKSMEGQTQQIGHNNQGCHDTPRSLCFYERK